MANQNRHADMIPQFLDGTGHHSSTIPPAATMIGSQVGPGRVGTIGTVVLHLPRPPPPLPAIVVIMGPAVRSVEVFPGDGCRTDVRGC
jgi:hypothetical protein